MKSLAIIIAVLAALTFVVGGVLAVVGTVPVQQYALAGGIIGSLASVVGLAALIRPRLTASDLRNVESELIGNVAQATRAIEEYESKISKNKEQIDKLERDRKEIELLVREASLKVFLEERLKNIAGEIDKRVSRDSQLENLLDQYSEGIAKVIAIEGNLQKSDRAELIEEIVAECRSRALMDSRAFTQEIAQTIPFGSLIFRMSDFLVDKLAGRFLGLPR